MYLNKLASFTFSFMKKVFILSVLAFLTFPFFSSANASPFTDTSEDKNRTAIDFLYQTQVISGYSDNTFRPKNTINRAELIKIFIESRNVTPTLQEYKNCFLDVKEEWFAPYICYAKKKGWIQGYDGNIFFPAHNVNKAEAIKMLINSQTNGHISEVVNEIEVLFDDVDNKAWYAKFIKAAKDMAILEQMGGIYGIGDSITRGEISENIYRLMTIRDLGLKSFMEYQAIKNQVGLYLVTKVVDGDTIDVNILGETKRIRLLGINTPESVVVGQPVECFGKEASAATEKKLLNTYVRLEVDSTQGDVDKYGKLLRYVFLPENNILFNQWLITSGYAFEYTYDTPYQYQEAFKQAQQEAMNNDLGLWSEGTCNGTANSVNQSNGDLNSTSGSEESTVYKFYVSSQAKTKYYCETDSAWKNLSPANLLMYESEGALKANFPTLILNKPC